MLTLSKLMNRYVRPEWKALLFAQSAAVMVTVLNVVSMAVFISIPTLLMRTFGNSENSVQIQRPSGGNALGVDIGAVLSKIDNLTMAIETEMGIVWALVFISCIYLGVIIVTRITQFSADSLIMTARSRASRLLSKDMFHHISNLSLEFFHRRQVGDLATRVTGDSSSLAQLSFDTVNILVTALPLFVFYWALLIGISWQLTLAAVVIFGIKTLVSKAYARRIRSSLEEAARYGGITSHKAVEAISNIFVVKAFGREKYEHEAFSGLIDTHADHYLERVHLEYKEQAVQTILYSVATVVTATLGAVFLVQGRIEVITLILFFFAAQRSNEPSRKLLTFIISLSKVRAIAVRVFDIFRETASVPDGMGDIGGFDSEIEFRDVSFRYVPDQHCLEKINFSIRKGEVIALVGASGSGKSTILNLLLRFYDPGHGGVLVDGKDAREYTQASYRRLFGVVTQDPILFNATIRDNIAYAATSDDVAMEDVVHASQIANVDEFVDKWRDGYDTFIGDRGVRLSGGQKQRVTLARAILRNPPVLILDEATSSLDSHSEKLIQNSIDSFLQNRTAIVVAHRLSTIQKADRIIVLDKGRIVEEGDHDELYKKNGMYRGLCDAQFGLSAEPMDIDDYE